MLHAEFHQNIHHHLGLFQAAGAATAMVLSLHGAQGLQQQRDHGGVAVASRPQQRRPASVFAGRKVQLRPSRNNMGRSIHGGTLK